MCIFHRFSIICKNRNRVDELLYGSFRIFKFSVGTNSTDRFVAGCSAVLMGSCLSEILSEDLDQIIV